MTRFKEFSNQEILQELVRRIGINQISKEEVFEVVAQAKKEMSK